MKCHRVHTNRSWILCSAVSLVVYLILSAALQCTTFGALDARLVDRLIPSPLGSGGSHTDMQILYLDVFLNQSRDGTANVQVLMNITNAVCIFGSTLTPWLLETH